MEVRARLGGLLLLATAGCASAAPQTVQPRETGSVDDSDDPTRIEEPVPASTPEPPPASAELDTAPESGSWFEPLPALTLSTLSAEQKDQLRACLDENGVRQPDASAAALFAGAQCAHEHGLPGHEIRLYKVLLARHPSADEGMVALRELGARYEQIDIRDEAIKAYVTYLRRYPKQTDARELGQRAVCLAWSLGDDDRISQTLADLERSYGRRGFEIPTPEELEQLCAAALLPESDR